MRRTELLTSERLVGFAAVCAVTAALLLTRLSRASDTPGYLLLALAGLSLLGAAAQARRGRTPALLIGTAAGAIVAGVTLARHADDFDWSRYMSWSTVALTVLGAAVLLALAPWVSSRPLLRPAPDPEEGSPWQLISRRRRQAQEEHREGMLRGRHAATSALVLALALWPLGTMVNDNDGDFSAAWPAVFAGLVVIFGLLALPIVRRERFGYRSLAQAHERALQRQQVAAHLHDSVLQTLSLIQRTDDPRQVQLLARQQERSLRDWLAGRDDQPGKTLAAALRAVCSEVEDELEGDVGCVCVGDAPLDEPQAALVWAVREATRNAVKHAGGPVQVFAEVERDQITAYVRDTGSGFSLEEVPAQRRGVRDAILGRMELAGGDAFIESGPQGTEISLRLPRQRAETISPGGA